MLPIKNNLQIIMAKKRIKSLMELSNRMDINYRTIYNFANDIHKKIDPVLISRLCEELDCELRDLLYIDKTYMQLKEYREI